MRQWWWRLQREELRAGQQGTLARRSSCAASWSWPDLCQAHPSTLESGWHVDIEALEPVMMIPWVPAAAGKEVTMDWVTVFTGGNSQRTGSQELSDCGNTSFPPAGKVRWGVGWGGDCFGYRAGFGL